MKGTVFLDLDGTLADTSHDIYNSLSKTMRKFGIPPVEFDTVLEFVGDGVRPLIKKILSYLKREGDEEEIVKDFIREYRRNITKETYIYNGMIETIFEIKRHGFKIILLTNKSHELTVKLLSELCILQIFDGIVSGDTFEVKKPSPELLEKIEERYGTLSNPKIMIGDGINDFQFARNINAHFILAKWGFSAKKIETDEKIFYASEPKDISSIIEKIETETNQL